MDILYLDEIRVAGLGCSKKSLWECIVNRKGHQIGVKLRNQVEYRYLMGTGAMKGFWRRYCRHSMPKTTRDKQDTPRAGIQRITQAQGSGQARHHVLTGHLKPHWNPRPRTDCSP